MKPLLAGLFVVVVALVVVKAATAFADDVYTESVRIGGAQAFLLPDAGDAGVDAGSQGTTTKFYQGQEVVADCTGDTVTYKTCVNGPCDAGPLDYRIPAAQNPPPRICMPLNSNRTIGFYRPSDGGAGTLCNLYVANPKTLCTH
jgi:hypothetical protein